MNNIKIKFIVLTDLQMMVRWLLLASLLKKVQGCAGAELTAEKLELLVSRHSCRRCGSRAAIVGMDKQIQVPNAYY